MSATRAETYLTLPLDYANRVGGLCWSAGGDAVERWNGTTLALTEEIGLVLDGVFGRQPVPPFVVVLHVLHLMRSDDSAPASARLRKAFRDAHGATGLLRNAGVLIAELCADVPPAVGVPYWADVDAARTRRRLFATTGFPLMADEPALSSGEVERRVTERLAKLSDDDLRHWFIHGCAPGTAGEALAAVVESLPARVARLLALAKQRPRLVGAAAVVPAVDAALTLPPRRRSPDAVPQGGYCDVTTRGDPDRLLPSQFALDPDEFVRRFAERELLYFLREEPQAAEKPDRVVVLDQGVRTWGAVRLALAAAAVVLLRKDAKRLGRVLLAATSTDQMFDLTTAAPVTVADVLEASDLTPNPRDCYTAAVSVAGDGPRDVILLTHPRSARNPALLAVPRRPGDRVFALTVGDDGRAELAEWGSAGPVPVRAFRVDLVAAEAAKVTTPRPAAAPLAMRLDSAWTGDVEPVAFPFRPGLVVEPVGLSFDADAEWLVAVGPQGVLHGLTLDNAPAEVLPRPFHGGAVMKQVDVVLPLAGGVAVCGRLDPIRGGAGVTVYPPGAPVMTSTASDDPPGQVYTVARYDRATRRVTVFRLGAATAAAKWDAFPELNCVVVRSLPPGTPGSAVVNLTTGDIFPSASGTWVDRHRVQPAIRQTMRGGAPPFTLPVLTADPKEVTGPYLRVWGNKLAVVNATPGWPPFEPKRDGRPLLAGADIVRAQLAGNTLALTVRRDRERTLAFFHGPDGRGLGEVPVTILSSLVALSPCGRRVARVKPSRTVVVADVPGTGPTLGSVAPAAVHNNLEVRVDANPFRLMVRVGSFAHVFLVREGELSHIVFTNTAVHPTWPTPQRPTAAAAPYDPARFPNSEAVTAGPWTAVPDRLGQVLLFAAGSGLVLSVLVRRELAAVWAPEGVFWGSAALIGGPPTRDAARVMGSALALYERG